MVDFLSVAIKDSLSSLQEAFDVQDADAGASERGRSRSAKGDEKDEKHPRTRSGSSKGSDSQPRNTKPSAVERIEREFFIDNLLVGIHFIVEMI